MDPVWLAVTLALTGPTGALAVPAMAAAPTSVVATTSAVAASATTPTTGAAPGAAAAPDPAASRRWKPPVEPPTVDRAFDAPEQRWLPGHRGVDLRAPAGTEIRAPADGTVAFAGMVAGRGVVSIDHADPRISGATLRSTYEPVEARVARGDAVVAGQVVAVIADDSHCPGGCLHWGARRDATYVDPMLFLSPGVRLWTPQRTG
ncbi:MAG: M23 family metallopeptidase [Mobilicoccus sp.]|nr:M23 family metallopeptidase [Mobilicoccus sp.]